MPSLFLKPVMLPNGWQLHGPYVRNRECGSCKLCCTLVPVEEPALHKAANEKCEYVCGKGCEIYHNRPDSCKYWTCRWLFDPRTTSLRRPDHCGYAIDPQQASVSLNGKQCLAMQVWVDPERPNGHKDAALRDYIDAVGKEHGMVTIIRWGNEVGCPTLLLVPPSLSINKTWLEKYSDAVALPEQIAKEKQKAVTWASQRILPKS